MCIRDRYKYSDDNTIYSFQMPNNIDISNINTSNFICTKGRDNGSFIYFIIQIIDIFDDKTIKFVIKNNNNKEIKVIFSYKENNIITKPMITSSFDVNKFEKHKSISITENFYIQNNTTDTQEQSQDDSQTTNTDSDTQQQSQDDSQQDDSQTNTDTQQQSQDDSQTTNTYSDTQNNINDNSNDNSNDYGYNYTNG